MTKGTSPFRVKPLKVVALVALLAASTVMQGVLAAEYIVTDLGTLGGSDSFAADLNEFGRVVGVSRTTDGALHAFLYSCGTMTDLNTLVPAGVIVTNATGINAAGQIVGDGRIGRSAHTHALLLTPTLLKRFAYALADLPTAASYTPDNHYSASGGAIRITRQGVGSYEVAFDKLPTCGAGASSAVAVTAYGSSSITCSVVAYSRASPSRTVAQVACFDVAPGQQRMTDSRFTIMVVGNQSLPVESAFVISGGPARDQALDPAWNWTSIPGRSIKVTREAPGDYAVLPGTGNTPISAKSPTTRRAGGLRMPP